jgi:hypothetical protein
MTVFLGYQAVEQERLTPQVSVVVSRSRSTVPVKPLHSDGLMFVLRLASQYAQH